MLDEIMVTNKKYKSKFNNLENKGNKHFNDVLKYNEMVMILMWKRNPNP